MTLELKHDNEIGGTTRIEQLGVIFPDGSILWANVESAHPEEQHVRWNERTYWLTSKRSPGAAKFEHLKADYTRQLAGLKIEVYDEAIRLVKRLVIAFFDDAKEVQA